MSFSPLRGSWISGTRLLASELAIWDANIANAFDAAAGGSYTLSAPAVFTGSAWTLPSLTVTTTLDVTTTLTAAANAVLGTSGANTLTVNSTPTFNAATTFASTTAFTGASVFNGAVTLGDAAGDAITVTGTATFGQKVTAPSAQIPKRVYTMTDADASISGDDYDVVYIPSAVIAANRTITLNTSDATGTEIEIYSFDATGSYYVAVAFDLPAAASINMRMTTSGYTSYAKFQIIGGNRVLVRQDVNS